MSVIGRGEELQPHLHMKELETVFVQDTGILLVRQRRDHLPGQHKWGTLLDRLVLDMKLEIQDQEAGLEEELAYLEVGEVYLEEREDEGVEVLVELRLVVGQVLEEV